MLIPVISLLIAEFIVYFAMYRSKYGRGAVYRTVYAWVIDVLAIISGTTISVAALYAINHPELFSIEFNTSIFWILFFFGSSQAVMHVAKWSIRILFKN